MKISACTDEAAIDLAAALDVLQEEGIRYADLRQVWGRSVVDLSEGQAREAQALLNRRGFQVSALSTPIGKTSIKDDFAPELARFRRALELAALFKAPYIRVFSFYVPDDEAAGYFPEAVNRLQQLSELAGEHGVSLAHENEEGGFCAWRPEECLRLQQALPDNFRTLFEPCSFVVMEYDAYPDALQLLRPYVAMVHVRDTQRGTTRYTVAGEGDVGWPKILADLQAHNFDGFVTLEPHLGWADKNLTAAQRVANFRRAAAALRQVMASKNAT